MGMSPHTLHYPLRLRTNQSVLMPERLSRRRFPLRNNQRHFETPLCHRWRDHTEWTGRLRCRSRLEVAQIHTASTRLRILPASPGAPRSCAFASAVELESREHRYCRPAPVRCERPESSECGGADLFAVRAGCPLVAFYLALLAQDTG